MQTHDCRPQITVTEKADDIGPQWVPVHELHPLFGCLPGLVLFQDRQHFLSGHGFNPGENIRGVFRIGAHHAQGTAADKHCGDTVTHRFRQRGRYQQLSIVVGMGIEKSRRYPATAGVDRASGQTGVRLFIKYPGNPAFFDAHVGYAGGTAGTIEITTTDNKSIELVHLARLLFVVLCRQSSQQNVICPLILVGGPCNMGH